ncbi:hypothetical protein Acy02nite_42100 [Actinoplanes cyaneus]|uniref:Protein kinase domain-containing protein n=1 Tax=Actinoplanes cyaneus TaxID=52696 RepID=A0A919IIE0_9ACTN|nr:Serine/threonine protein kinase [Actinoplanes cyaneus]GID66329.1 hypothetical protein Acy02nite_42100 [Actinoplanes cyaneus]
MGRVWRATDVVLHREVAIKELVPPPGLTPAERQEMRERSLREARAIARLNNINVVRVFDVLRTDADPWIVMEYVPSRSLQDTLAADGPYNPVRAAEIGLGVLNALKAAHRAGVVHRDIKPGNVLMGGDGRVVLTDFGLATVPGDPNVTRTGLVLGSPAYIAPERARDGTAGPAADLWSLGATLYAAVEGQSPFARPSAIATLAALATENVPPARNAGPLKPVLNGLLRKDPAHRIDADEAERLLARAAGRRAKISFPMSPTMRRPGVGRERPSLPSGPGGPPVLPGSGFVTATGSAPVVPTPRPPVTSRPADAPGRSQSGPSGVGNSSQGRSATPPVPPVGRSSFAPGRATVGNQPPSSQPGRAPVGDPQPGRVTGTSRPPVRPGHKPLDATKVDGPAVVDEPKGLASPGIPPGARGLASPAGQHPVPPAALAGPGQATPPREIAPGQATPPREIAPGQATPPREIAPGQAAPTRDTRPGQATPPRATPPGTATPPHGAGPVRATPADHSAGPMVNTARVGFTAADVAANRRRQAAPEHEASLAAATGAYPVVATPEPAEAETAEAPAEAVVAAEKPTPEKPEKAEPTPVQAEESVAAGTVAEQATIEAYESEPRESDPDQAESDSSEPVKPEPEAPTAEAEAPVQAAEGSAEPEPAATEPEPEPEEQPEAQQPEAKQPEPDPSEAKQPEPESKQPESKQPEPVKEEKSADRPATALVPGRRPESTTRDELKTPVVGDEDKTSVVRPEVKKSVARDEDKTSVFRAEDKTSVVDFTAIAPQSPATRPDDGATRVVGSLPSVPGFAPSSRPAWTPMPARPPVRRVEGVTIFGTTLTRRQAIIGAAIVLTFVLLVGIILVQAFGDGDDKQASPGASTPAAVAGGKAPDARPSTGSTGGASAAATKPSAAPPSSAPASSAPAASVPAGWKTVSLGSYSIAVPANASFGGGSGGSKQTEFNGRQLYIFQYSGDESPATMFPLNPRPSGFQGQISLEQLTYQGRPAADWQYYRGTGNGGKQRVLRRGFTVDGKTYQICWYAMEDDWQASQKDLAAVFAGFKVG